MNLFEKIKQKSSNPKTQIEMEDWRTVEKLNPASLDDIKQFEEKIGFFLPPILKEAYCTISNGFFGPGYGFLPLFSYDKYDENIYDIHQDFLEFSFWNPSYIALIHWGCGIYSCMDLANPNENIFVFDGNMYDEEGNTTCIFETKRNLKSFLEAWTNNISIWKEMYGEI